MKFSDIETISQGVSDYLSDNKIVDMTEIQRQTYKHIMDNRDIIACSQITMNWCTEAWNFNRFTLYKSLAFQD